MTAAIISLSDPPLKSSLYQRILGARFAQLPEPMRSFHASPAGAHAHGTLRVVRGSGFITRLVARLAGLPPSAEKAEIQLDVRPEGNRERWIRRFGDHELSSLQWERDGLLIDQLPGVRLGIELVLEGDQLLHHVRRAWVGPIPIPLAIAPRVETVAQGTSFGWRLHVRVALPLLGTLIEYDGDVFVG